MERLADLRSSDVSSGSGQTSQYKRVFTDTNPTEEPITSGLMSKG